MVFLKHTHTIVYLQRLHEHLQGFTPHEKHHRTSFPKETKRDTKRKQNFSFDYVSSFGDVNLNIKKKKNINLVQLMNEYYFTLKSIINSKNVETDWLYHDLKFFYLFWFHHISETVLVFL